MPWLSFFFNQLIGSSGPTPYPPPTGLSYEMNGDGIRLNWDDSSAQRWFIYRNTVDDFLTANPLGSVNGNDPPTFMDPTVSQGNSYWYYVVAEKILDGGIVSEPAATGEIQFNPPAP